MEGADLIRFDLLAENPYTYWATRSGLAWT